MYRKEINIPRKIVHQVGFIYKIATLIYIEKLFGSQPEDGFMKKKPKHVAVIIVDLLTVLHNKSCVRLYNCMYFIDYW